MARPDDRPLRRLPTLEASKETLERCVFCPKLCRTTCPVSNAEPRETLTPWGKMSLTYFVATESVPLEPALAAPAWACTGCFGCREQCDHKNDVTGTLFAARSAMNAAGAAPPAAQAVLARESERLADLGNEARGFAALEEMAPYLARGAKTALLVGCAYTRDAGRRRETTDAVRATSALVGGPVTLIDTCCGAPLLHAGDHDRFVAQGERLTRAIGAAERVVVVDAGCASTLRIHHAKVGPPMVHLSELAARELGRLGRVADLGAAEGEVRWHDPCQLGRGLGIYDAPRAVLTRALGRAPAEFPRRREGARCSGAGGLLPVTMPETSAAIARARLDEHEEAGGGTVVTACASSGRRFEKSGARVLDLATVIARSLGVAGG